MNETSYFMKHQSTNAHDIFLQLFLHMCLYFFLFPKKEKCSPLAFFKPHKSLIDMCKKFRHLLSMWKTCILQTNITDQSLAFQI